VTVTADGMVAVTGVIQARATFGRGEREASLESPSNDSIFVARFVP
jgi:hypothetical protein